MPAKKIFSTDHTKNQSNMCTICGSTNCNGNQRTRQKTVKVYGKYKDHSSQREYLGTTTVNDYDDEKTIHRKIAAQYTDWEIYV